jgi:hypothetical protein
MPLFKRPDGDIMPNSGGQMIMPMITMNIPISRKKNSASIEEKRLMQTMYSDMKQDMKNELLSMLEMAKYDLVKMDKMYVRELSS